MERSQERLALMERIRELEAKELWHVDAFENPETYPLEPGKVDYLNERLSSRIMTYFANRAGTRFFERMLNIISVLGVHF